MRARTQARLLGLGGLVLLTGVFTAVRAQQEEPFPHADHAGLFPVCTGCHAGVEIGVAEAAYPQPALCARCHDGVAEERVSWQGPTRAPTNVTFDHEVHAEELQREGDPAQSCEACHSASPEARMEVTAEENLGTCWSCHAHQTDDHYAVPTECETCHIPLAETSFTRDRIETLPLPDSHADSLFLPELHGRAVPGYADRCATCHTSDRCVACHVDATLIEIVAIPSAPETMELPEYVAEYPVPSSHVDEGWLDAHRLAVPVRECSTCHTEDDCRSCHVGIIPSAVEALPRRAETEAPGVALVSHAPDTHASLFFLSAHPTLAAADGQSCATCHTESYCADCHAGPADGGYHPPSFVARHSADAFARTDECATCHSAEVFCRACHEDSGLGSSGRLGAGFHDAEPVWLLRHGQAARQSLETCTSCHRQNDCVQCHGVLGTFSVSPHTRDFDAQAAWQRSPSTCLACHVTNPVGGSP